MIILAAKCSSYIWKFTAGPIECETVYETECSTAYHLHEVEEDSPNCRIQMVSCAQTACIV